MRDSIGNKETQKEALRQSLKYEYEKEMLIREKEQEKREEKQRIILYAIIAILILVVLFSVIIYNRLRVTRKQSAEISRQKSLVEKKNKEIIDSINYANRIQQALLKTEEYVSEHLPPHFVLFLPKDIVSGDFYWSHEVDEYMYVAVSDCTGHGVPGAFMSMLGIAFLNEICARGKYLSPAEILDRLRYKIIEELSQTGKDGGNKDGMDISLAKINLTTNKIEWAGVNNPLWIIRSKDGKENKKLEVIKGDRQPIGHYAAMKPFKNHFINLFKGDTIYLFSDGFADQFGGPKKRKFMVKNFKREIMDITGEPLGKQKQLLKSTFYEWKSHYEQVDDVCILGLRIT